MTKRDDETQTAYAIRAICEDAVGRERDRIMTALAEIDPADWALAGSEALHVIVRPVVLDRCHR